MVFGSSRLRKGRVIQQFIEVNPLVINVQQLAPISLNIVRTIAFIINSLISNRCVKLFEVGILPGIAKVFGRH